MIDDIIKSKTKIEELKNKIGNSDDTVDKATLCKVLIMLNIAEMVIYANIKIPENEKYYFEGQAFIGRYFGGWGLDWIADDYLKFVYSFCRYSTNSTRRI
jgi:hypothetical protein